MGWQNEHILWIFNFPLFHSSSLIDWEPRFKLQSRVETKGMCTLTLTNEKGWKTFTMVFNLSCSAAFFICNKNPTLLRNLGWKSLYFLFTCLFCLRERLLKQVKRDGHGYRTFDQISHEWIICLSPQQNACLCACMCACVWPPSMTCLSNRHYQAVWAFSLVPRMPNKPHGYARQLQ